MFKKNERLVDWWSLVHLVTSAALTVLLGPVLALAVVLLWEPFELLILSSLLAKRGVDFGNEDWKNVTSDVVFDGLGVVAGLLIF